MRVWLIHFIFLSALLLLVFACDSGGTTDSLPDGDMEQEDELTPNGDEELEQTETENSEIDNDIELDEEPDGDRDLDTDEDHATDETDQENELEPEVEPEVEFEMDPEIEEESEPDTIEDDEADIEEDSDPDPTAGCSADCIAPAHAPDCNGGYCRIPAGCFCMGSPEDEPGRYTYEQQHDVTLTHDFMMAQTETTQGDFTTRMGWNPSHWGPNFGSENCGDNCPVEMSNWYEAAAYANQLSEVEGLTPCYLLLFARCEDGREVGTDYMQCYDQNGVRDAVVALNGVDTPYDCAGYRLPTEAEWEYAARAGTISALYSGEVSDEDCSEPNLDTIGWYCGNSDEKTWPAAQKAPNAWGLYDMSGNVFEWTWDWWAFDYDGLQNVVDPTGPEQGTGKISRGGSHEDRSIECRSAYRPDVNPVYRDSYQGFRLVRTLP